MDAKRGQGSQRALHQLPGNARAPMLGRHSRVVDITPAAVMSGDDDAHDVAARGRHIAGLRVSIQETPDALPGIVQVIQPHALAGQPQPVHGFIVIQGHCPYGRHVVHPLRRLFLVVLADNRLRALIAIAFIG